MTQFINLMKKLKTYEYKFITKDFKKHVKNIVGKLFPKLNPQDSKYLIRLSWYLIEDISLKFFDMDISKVENKYYEQWIQNNSQDIISTILMLLPFINNKDNYKLYKELTDLNHILFNSYDEKHISKKYLEIPRIELLKNKFKYSNFAIGLLNNNNKNLLELYEKDPDTLDYDKLIHKIMYHNFISLLETIKITNGKLYVNWIHTTPLNLENYKTSNLYIKTKETIDKIKQTNITDEKKLEIIQNNNGLYFGDIYNVYRNYYYRDIKKIKWYIFNKKIRGKGTYMIQYLNKIINFDTLFKYDDYDDLNFIEKNDFESSFTNIVNSLISDSAFKIDKEFEKDLLGALMAFLVNDYTYKYKLTSKVFKPFKIDEHEFNIEGKEEFDKIEKLLLTNIDIITKYKIVDAYKKIDKHHLWNYLKESLELFKTTIYSTYLIKNNKIVNEDEFFNLSDNDGNKIQLNLKNIYNISKTLSHKEINDNWIIYPEIFNSLDKEDTKIFYNRIGLLSTDETENKYKWLKLSRNIMIQEGLTSANSSDLEIKKREIIDNFLKISNKIVWECLIKNGIISNFKINPKLTNKSLQPKNDKDNIKFIRNELKKSINLKDKDKDNRKDLDKSYYYVNNKKFKDLEINDQKYLDYITENDDWYTYYAMNWISQINFYNHYINHQILYVTGSTGAGKSTQIPKLLLYATKMYDYKSKGKVITTQPRIPPTENNTTWIAMGMGIPINKKINNKYNITTDNYNLQFKHSQKQHTRENHLGLLFKTVTDGTLYQELLNNPIMKEQIPNNKLTIEGKMDFIYGINNKYDVMIIDESHEHNTNMDLILTLARYACFHNNSLRLVITSATMEDDEPIYRSYYKEINDNFLYPIKRPITNKFVKDFMIYSILLDRRIHISEPGKTTRFKINDIYLPDDEDIENLDNTSNSLNTLELAINIANNICNRSQSGQILLFTTGTREILKTVKKINKITQRNVIALPYYGTGLNQKYKEYIEKIDIYISKIKNNKNKIHLEWGETFIEDNSIPDNLYTRAIIVATNVAEASITIPGLEYVIDTGYSKENKYNSTFRTSKLIVEKISESSRIQRRGRVGRKLDGYVYYTYKKNTRSDILPKYNITQENFEPHIINLLTNDKNIFSPFHHSGIDYHLYLNNDIEFNPYNKLKDIFSDEHELNIANTLGFQYIIIDNGSITKPNNEYFQEPYFKINNEIPKYFNRYLTGYAIATCLDLDGKFYIVNKFENEITRNIENDIIKFQGSNEKNIPDEIFRNIISILNQKSYLFVNPSNRLDYNEMTKTHLNNKINELRRDLFLNENNAICLIAAKAYDVYEEVISIISMLDTIDYKVSNLAKIIKKYNKREIPDFFSLYKLYGNQDSDIIGIYKITKLIKNKFSKLLIFKLINDESILMNILREKYDYYCKKYIEFNNENKLNDFINLIKKNKNVAEIEIELNLFNWLKYNGKINKESGFLLWINKSKKIREIISEDIENNYDEILNWSNNNVLNHEIIKKYLYNYMDQVINIITIKKNYNDEINEESSFDWIENLKYSFNNSLINRSIENKIIMSFLYANPISICIKLNLNDTEYVLTSNSRIRIQPKKLIPGKNINNSLCNKNTSCIFYLNISENRNNSSSFSIITNIKPEIITRTNPLYYNKLFFKNNYIDNEFININNSIRYNTKLIKINGKLYDDFIKKIENNWSLNYYVWNDESLPIIKKYIQAFIKKF